VSIMTLASSTIKRTLHALNRERLNAVKHHHAQLTPRAHACRDALAPDAGARAAAGVGLDRALLQGADADVLVPCADPGDALAAAPGLHKEPSYLRHHAAARPR